MLEYVQRRVVGISYALCFELFELPFHSFFLFRSVEDIYWDLHRKMGKTPRYPHDQSSFINVNLILHRAVLKPYRVSYAILFCMTKHTNCILGLSTYFT